MSRTIRVLDALDRQYGEKKWAYKRPLLDELIYTLLSQTTTAKNCDEAFARLRERFSTWERVRLAPLEDMAEAIAVAGLANRRAPRIKRILEDIYEQQRNLDLDWIAERSDPAAIDYLMRFDGVGRKTAACVLMFGLNRPVMPVDTHVHRVAMRLGLIPEVNADKAHDLLQEIIPPERIYSVHVNMVGHGRQVCHAGRPKCEICVLRRDCDYFVERTKAG